MVNNFLNELLGKISAYDLFNVLIPGALVTYFASQTPLGSFIDCSNWMALSVMSYVLGLIASRIGSLCIEPLVQNLKPTRKRKGCNLIVSHHPLIFRKLARISDENYVQRTVRKAIKNDITIVAMHTNMDAAAGGVNFKIAEKLGLRNVQFFAGEKEVDGVKGGEGVIGEVAEDLAADDLVLMLKERFGVECVQCNQLLRRPIRKVALCGGAGAFLLDAAIKAGADAFITGEMSYHEYFGHEQEIQICVIGHYQSEQFTGEIFRSIIQENFPDAKCCISEINTNPILYL